MKLILMTACDGVIVKHMLADCLNFCFRSAVNETGMWNVSS